MENNIDTQLELALETMQSYEDSESELYVGYNAKDRSWQLLIRYNDDITDLVDRYLTRKCISMHLQQIPESCMWINQRV